MTPTRQGVAFFTFMWKDDIERGIFDNGEYNVYGTSPNGTKATKMPLNAEKVVPICSFL